MISRNTIEYESLPNVILNDCIIEYIDKVRNLGLIFNRKPHHDHITSIVGKVYGMLRTLWVNQCYTPVKIRTMLVKSYLLPTLLYGCEMYANCDYYDKSKLNLLFNNITRYIHNLKKFYHVSAFSIKIFSMSFEDLLKYRVLIFLQKIIANKEPSYLFNKLCFLTSTRHSNNLRSIRVKYLVSERQFFV